MVELSRAEPTRRAQPWHRPVLVVVPVAVALAVPVSVAVPASDDGQFGGPNRRHRTPPSPAPSLLHSPGSTHTQLGKLANMVAAEHRRCLCLVCKPEHGHESGLSCFCSRWHFIVVAESKLRCVAALLFAVLPLLLLLLVLLFLCCCCCGG